MRRTLCAGGNLRADPARDIHPTAAEDGGSPRKRHLRVDCCYRSLTISKAAQGMLTSIEGIGWGRGLAGQNEPEQPLPVIDGQASSGWETLGYGVALMMRIGASRPILRG